MSAGRDAPHRPGRGRRPAVDLIRINSTNPLSGHPSGRARSGWPRSSTRSAIDLARSSRRRRAAPLDNRAHQRQRMTLARSLLVHGHLDVVPAEPADWRSTRSRREMRDDYVWGRGAVDMKDMDAMTLARHSANVHDGHKPPRDIVLAFVADEEAGGRQARITWSTTTPNLFAGCTEAISEVGGFSVSLTRALGST